VSLSGISSLSLTQNSLFSELAEAAKTTNSTGSAPVPASGFTPVSTNSTDGASDTSASQTLANDLASLLTSLGSGDVSGAQAALKKVEADLQAQGSGSSGASNPSSSSTSSTSSASSTSSSSGSQSTNPLTNLLNQLSSALNSGDTNSALQDLTSFLLSTGQGNGSAVNVNA
jgi:hypothetical protein